MKNAPDNESRYRVAACGLPWFRHRRDLKVFEAQKLSCVYAIGPVGGRPLKIGYCANPQVYLTEIQACHWAEMKLHEMVWTSGAPVARRLEDELHRLFDKASRRIRGEWFDVPIEMVLPAFDVAARNLKIKTFTHDAMLEGIAVAQDAKTASVLKALGADDRLVPSKP
ncbi:GIY-YIG nuclease family protein [Methylobacterium ajmalii]|uniref:GIY-YIG nuclease family protein n=1 Tax=Methylobacterium ajmalii TaxID=2738439 RepID=UPI002F35D47F